MSNFLQHLWDETLAGPAPGSGKLRRSGSASASLSPTIPVKVCDDVRITRSITILRTNSRNSSDDRTGTLADDSLAGVMSPRTPTTPGTPGGDLRRFSWRNSFKSSERDA